MRNVFISSIVVFLVNFLLQTFLTYFLKTNDGEILSSPLVKNDSLNYSQTLIISNFQKRTIENLEFSIPTGNIKKLNSDQPLQFDIVSSKIFRIEKIYPNSNSTITVNLLLNDSNYNELGVVPLNYSDFDLKYKKISDIKKPSLIDWLTITINCLIVAIFFGVILHYTDLRINNITKESKERIMEIEKDIKLTEEENEKNKSKLEKLEVKLANYSNSWTKLRILLLGRARDLKKENDFYRLLIIEIFKKSGKELDHEKLEEIVRSTLKTYSAKGDTFSEIQTIDVIANIVKDKG